MFWSFLTFFQFVKEAFIFEPTILGRKHITSQVFKKYFMAEKPFKLQWRSC